MTEDQIERWAELLIDYCLDVQPGQTVLVGAEFEARPLVEACFRAIVDRQAEPIVRLDLPGLHEYYLRNAADSQLVRESPIGLFEARNIDSRLRITAESDTRSMVRVDPRRQAMYNRARDSVRKAASEKRWALTQYPTAAYAANAGMSLDDYEAFVVSALFLDRADPVAAWKELGRRQAGLVEYMSNVNNIRIEAEGTDLELSVAGRRWINSDGKRNMPSGEIFTGPVEDSVRGKLRCGFPVCRDGHELVGISLEVEFGRVVVADADQGGEYLRAMLDLDEGARRFGELGLGLNAGIDRFTGSILYDEKIGGTVHLALGQSYPETGGTNASALHWDLIVDTRTDGRITADGKVVMENGRWLVG